MQLVGEGQGHLVAALALLWCLVQIEWHLSVLGRRRCDRRCGRIWRSSGLLPFCGAAIPTIPAQDWLWLALLGVLCTGLAHSLFVASLRVLKARTTSVIFALEPVYGIAFAWWLFNEQPTLRMLIGGALIIIASVITSRLKSPAPTPQPVS